MLLAEDLTAKSIELTARNATGDEVGTATRPLIERLHKTVQDWAAFGMFCIPRTGSSKLWSLDWAAFDTSWSSVGAQTLDIFFHQVAMSDLPPSGN